MYVHNYRTILTICNERKLKQCSYHMCRVHILLLNYVAKCFFPSKFHFPLPQFTDTFHMELTLKYTITLPRWGIESQCKCQLKIFSLQIRLSFRSASYLANGFSNSIETDLRVEFGYLFRCVFNYLAFFPFVSINCDLT